MILGNGDEIVGQGVCWQVCFELQGIVVLQDYLALELGNSDIILGLQWLETLVPVTTNWKKH